MTLRYAIFDRTHSRQGLSYSRLAHFRYRRPLQPPLALIGQPAPLADVL